MKSSCFCTVAYTLLWSCQRITIGYEWEGEGENEFFGMVNGNHAYMSCYENLMKMKFLPFLINWLRHWVWNYAFIARSYEYAWPFQAWNGLTLRYRLFAFLVRILKKILTFRRMKCRNHNFLQRQNWKMRNLKLYQKRFTYASFCFF